MNDKKLYVCPTMKEVEITTGCVLLEGSPTNGTREGYQYGGEWED